MTYDEFLAQARALPTGYGAAGSNGLFDAYGSNYADAPRYDYYQKALGDYTAANAAPPTFAGGNALDWAEAQPAIGADVQKQYDAWRGTLTPSQLAEYDLVSSAHSDKRGATLQGGFLAALAAMTAGAGLAAAGAEGGAAGGLLGGGAGDAGAGLGWMGGADGVGLGTMGDAIGGMSAAEYAAAADAAGGLLPQFGSDAAYTAGLGSSAGWAAAPSLGGVISPGYPAASLIGTGASSGLLDGVTAKDVLGSPALGSGLEGLLSGLNAGNTVIPGQQVVMGSQGADPIGGLLSSQAQTEAVRQGLQSKLRERMYGTA